MSKPPNTRSSLSGSRPPIPVVGLTGGIGSGKSTVAGIFRSHGVPVVDADQLARAVVEPGRTALEQIVDHFGPQMLLNNGDLNRSALARTVFSDEMALRVLNEITHPAILEEAMNELSRLQRQGLGWAMYEAAIIVDTKLAPKLESLIVVTATEAVRLVRVMDRDELSARDVLARMASQARPEILATQADLLIENDGSMDDLNTRVTQILSELTTRLGLVRVPGDEE